MNDDFKKQIDNLFKNEKTLIYDASLSQLIEEAKNGNPLAWEEIYETFLWGDNRKRRLSEPRFKTTKNLNIARFFNKHLIDYKKWCLGLAEKQPFTNYNKDDSTLYGLSCQLHESAIIEGLAQNYEESRKLYLETINFMLKNIEPKEWDFSVFVCFKELIDEQKESEVENNIF